MIVTINTTLGCLGDEDELKEELENENRATESILPAIFGDQYKLQGTCVHVVSTHSISVWTRGGSFFFFFLSLHFTAGTCDGV